MTLHVDDDDDRRRADRYTIRAQGILSFAQQSWQCHVVNVSETGVLLAIVEDFVLRNNDTVRLLVELDSTLTPGLVEESPAAELNNVDSSQVKEEPRPTLLLLGKVSHIKGHFVGVGINPASEADRNALETLLIQAEVYAEQNQNPS